MQGQNRKNMHFFEFYLKKQACPTLIRGSLSLTLWKKKGLNKIEVFANPNSERNYEIHMECSEFTCLCPKTGQPDFADLDIFYIPDQRCIELKSLKLYLWSYRNEGTFHEAVINKILDDLATACNPRSMRIIGDFYIRGGIHTAITAEYRAGDKLKKSSRKKNK